MIDATVSALGGDLYETYKCWAIDTGEQEMTETMFRERMSARFQKKKTNKGIRYAGIAIRPFDPGDPVGEKVTE